MADSAARRQPLLCFGAAGAGRVHEPAPPGGRQLQHSCSHGTGLLLGTRAAALVEAMHKSIRDAEVLVAGGGPAGLAAAIASRQAGFAVTVVDGAHPRSGEQTSELQSPCTLVC